MLDPKLDGVKAKLQAQKNLDAGITSDLYSHLTEVFSRIMQYHPYDGYDRFEEISGLVKQTNLKIKDLKYDYEVNASFKVDKQTTNREALVMIEKAKKLIKEQPDVGVSAADRMLLDKDQ